jgi:hypothetical protein
MATGGRIARMVRNVSKNTLASLSRKSLLLLCNEEHGLQYNP